MIAIEKILDNIDTGIILIDKDMRILSMNNWFNIYAEIDIFEVVGNFLVDTFSISLLNINTIKRYIKSVLLLKTPGYISAVTHGDLFQIPYVSVLKSEYKYMQTGIKFVLIGDNSIAIIVTDKTSLMSAYNTIEHKNNALKVDLGILRQSNTVLESEKKDIATKAYYDELTQLPNRRLLLSRFEDNFALVEQNDSTFAVLFFDLDKFKEINDNLGHGIGDAVLISIATTLEKYIQHGDTVARIGGDEFVMLMSSVQDVKELEKLILKILASVSRKKYIQEHLLHITMSVGVSLCPADGSNVKTLLKNADLALYDAKRKGKDTFSFFKDIGN